MPLPRPVPFVSQEGDPTGCWFACAQMLRMYYEGSSARPERIPELENPDGSHKRMQGNAYAKFQTIERLQPLSRTIPMNTAQDIDAALSEFGPIIFSWDGGLHVSVAIGVRGLDLCYHDPAVGANQSILASTLQARCSGPMGVTTGMLVRNPKLGQPVAAPKGIVRASDGVIKKYPLKWPTGWWRVFDGGTWYYYLAEGGIAMSSKSPPPSNSLGPPAKAHNIGRWTFSPPRTLVVKWKQVAGAKAPCEETFSNATEECEQMNATSNLYCPLEAKRYRG